MKKILLSVMSVGAAGLLMGAATFAVFTASASNPNNVFSTGILSITTALSSGFINMSNMKPGDTVNQTLQVNNPGTLALNYTVNASANPPGALGDQLLITANDSSNNVYGPTGVGSFSIPSRPIVASSNETLNFSVQLNPSSNNTFQNMTTNVTFNFNATQQ